MGDPMNTALRQKEPRVYYMVEQCLVDAFTCVKSTVQSPDSMEDAGVPYVAIAKTGTPSCSPASIAPSGRGTGWWLFLASLAMAVMARGRTRRGG